MPNAQTKIAIVAALEREVASLVRDWKSLPREHEAQQFLFREHEGAVCVCGGIGVQAARRAAEAAIALYRPGRLLSVGFAGALDSTLRAGNIILPSLVIDARDGSRFQAINGKGTLLTFMEIAGISQKQKLGEAYSAQAVDMEAAAVAAVASRHSIPFSAIKAISDEVDFDLPDTGRFIDPAGQFQTARFVLNAAVRPWLWTRIAALAQNSNKAAHSLSAHLRVLLAEDSIASGLYLAAPTGARR